jgi:signal transduction histidine kinase
METQLQRFLRAGKAAPLLVEREVDLTVLVEEVLRLVQPVARHAGVELSWRAASRPPVVNGDDEALAQAVMNLMLNAIEAVQHLGADVARRVAAEISDRRPGFAEFVVSDNGPGPASAVAEQLFTPFVTSKPEGVGLGLAAAKRIVEAHRGTIEWVRSEGMTQFRIEIPLAAKGEGRV